MNCRLGTSSRGAGLFSPRLQQLLRLSRRLERDAEQVPSPKQVGGEVVAPCLYPITILNM